MSTTNPARVSAGVPSGGQFAASTRGEAAVSLAGTTADIQSVPAALAATLTMNRVEAENHVRSLIDDAAADGDAERIEEIASLAAGAGWKGVAYVRGYPGTGNPETGPTDYLPTRAAATRTAEHAWTQTIAAERRAADKTSAGSPA